MCQVIRTLAGSANNQDADLFDLIIQAKSQDKLESLHPLIPSLVPATSPSHFRPTYLALPSFTSSVPYSTPDSLSHFSEWRLSLELYSVPSTKVPHSDLIPSHFGLLPHLYAILTGQRSLPHPLRLIFLLALFFFTLHTSHDVSSLLASPVLSIPSSLQYP